MTIDKQGRVSGPVLVLLGTTLFCIVAVGNAFVLDAIVGSFQPLWLGGMLLLETVLVSGVLLLWPQLRPTARCNGLEIIGIAVVGGVVLLHAIHLAPDDLMPVAFTVDTPHQHLLVNYIYQNAHFPDDVDYLYVYDDYPVAPSAWAAFLARSLGVLPVQTMYPLAALLVAAQVMLTYAVISELLPERPVSHMLATLGALATLLPYQYSIHVFTQRFYSNMIVGDLIVLLTLWLITVKDRLHPAFIAGIAVCLTFGCLNSYPAWLPFVIVPLLVSLLLDQRLSVPQRLLTASIIGGIAGVLTVMAVLDQWDFITWFAPVRDRRLLPDRQSLSSILLLLTIPGAYALIRTWRRRSGFALFLGIDLALVCAIYVFALWDKLALYIPDKTFYFNIFALAILVGLGLDRAWDHFAERRPGRARIAGALMIVIGFAVLLFANWRVPSPKVYPISLSEYRVAYQLAQEMPDEDITYLVHTPATFYWIYGCILNHTNDLEQQSERWQAETPTYDGWIQDATAPRRALVSDLMDLPQDGRWRAVIRAGDSALIEKTP